MVSVRFLNSALSNPWLQTSSGSCTKPGTPRQWGGEQRRLSPLPRGANGKHPSDPHGGYPVTPHGRKTKGCHPLTGANRGQEWDALTRIPFLPALKHGVSWEVFYESERTKVAGRYDPPAVYGAHESARPTPSVDRAREMDLRAVCISHLWRVVERPHRNEWMLVDPRGCIRCFGDLARLRQVATRLNGSSVTPDT